MAADVTLVALPDTPENWRWARLATHEELFDDDEPLMDGGEVVGYLDGAERSKWRWRLLYERVSSFEVGPISWLKAALEFDGAPEYWLPGPAAAVETLWSRAALVTPATIAETMVRLNLPDRSHYRSWRRRSVGDYKAGRRRAQYSRGYRRVARRQDVKRWLVAHQGWIMWAEHW